ncbi:MAG: aminopeptidase P family protein [Planctomycetes bacterium]|nr:aminopeptidase P family protein [Planctomycetota bacterium]
MKRILALPILCLLLAAPAALAQSPDARAETPGPEVYRERRARLAESAGDGSLIVLGNVAGEFQPRNKYFYYLTGVTGETGVLALYRSQKDLRELLFLPESSAGDEIWNGPILAHGPAAQKTTGLKTLPLDSAAESLGTLVSQARRLLLDPAEFEGDGTIRAVAEVLARSGVETESPAGILDGMRLVKDRHELALLQRAIDVTGAGILEAMRSAEPGMHEYELQAVAEYLFRRGGSEGNGFDSILGSGPNSCILHYRDNRRKMEDGDLVVMDIGAEFRVYTADVTRTYPVSGRFSKRQKEIYDLVLAAQEAGIATCRPGKTVHEVHAAAERVLARAGMAEHFWHGTSHWLGLDVHDVGDYSQPLEPGMVLTVEPGIYLPNEELGVRIEDDVLVTDGDPLVLSGWIPRKTDEIETWMAQEGFGNVRREYEKAK